MAKHSESHETHKQRHIELHGALDELVADFIAHGKIGEHRPSETTVMELMKWSHQQTQDPTETYP
jgi:hypothetical protein